MLISLHSLVLDYFQYMNKQQDCANIANLLLQLKHSIKMGILSQTFQSPLHNYYKQFSFESLKFERFKRGKINISLMSLAGIVRLLEIIEAVTSLVEKKQYITKRNLYYKLVNYYKTYALVDTDIELLAFNIGVLREDLHILSSSRCIILGDLTLELDNDPLFCSSKMISNVTCYRKITGLKTKSKNLMIIQKQSALYQINQFLKNSDQGPLKTVQFLKDFIFVTAKGYPDNNCRGIVQALSQVVENIYYLGDEDIYGVDILLCYSIGYHRYSTILQRVKWIELCNIIDPTFLKSEYQTLTKEDKKKYIELINKKFFKELDDFIPDTSGEKQFKQKLLRWKKRLREIRQSNRKFQLQTLFKYAPPDWIYQIINENLYT